MPGHVDMFDLVGSSALRYWTVLAGAAVACAALGFFVVTGAPQKLESDAVLQRSALPEVSAPNLGDPERYLKPVLFQAALHMVTSADFNPRVSNRPRGTGWTSEKGATQKHEMSNEEISRMLKATGETLPDGAYLIKFRATTTSADTCQALVGTSCDEIRDWYFTQRTADVEAQIQLYTRLLEETRERLERISAQKLTEFSVKGSTSIGVSIQERSAQMTADLRKAISDLQTEKINLTAAKQEEEALKEIADRIPPFEEMKPDARLEALKKFSEDLNKQHLELARKREEYGPEHPIQKDIRRVQEDLRLVEKEIEELERTNEADTEKRKPSPLRTQADSRLVEARAKTSVVQLRVSALELEIPKLETELAMLREQYEASLALRESEKDLQDRRAMFQKTLDDLANVRNAAARELVISTAPVHGKAVARQELVGIAVGLVAGLVIGLGIAVALMRRRQAAESEMMA
jgi:capsular polysaccharide biosynthesis protein